MLTVKNNHITVSKGETSMLQYIGVKRNGEPYILAPQVQQGTPLADRKDYAVLALTIRTSIFGDIVLAKYFDLEAEPMYDGVTDYSQYGLHKFTSQKINTISDLADIEENQVYKYNDTFVVAIQNSMGQREIKTYQFKLQMPFTWMELEKLESKEYLYDIILYYGALTDEYIEARANNLDDPEGFPLKLDANLVKIPLVKPHKFIVEESNNV